jgi:hypothetical protein
MKKVKRGGAQMRDQLVRVVVSTAIAVVALLSFPALAFADGGPILSDPELWASLKEGQQTAVVRLNRDNTARIDLFVTMLDSSGTSHEVVYFVPLGKEASDFAVVEESSLDFDRGQTNSLDATVRQNAHDRNNTWAYLLGASAPIGGAWLLPLYVPSVFLVGCAAGPAPEATFETESSSVSIYSLESDTNLEDLINTTGLDASVQETLSRLKGQRIAVVNLRTQPGSFGGSSSFPTGQPGIHLSWTSTMARQSGHAVYSYPLGTGSAWSSPIELTRVYVVAPAGLDFSVRYPRLGEDRSGYNFAFIFGQDTPRILGYYDRRSYAIDEANGSFGRIWRATYSQSNSSEDIVIQTGSRGVLVSARQLLGGVNGAGSLLIAVVVAAAMWVLAWRYVMPRLSDFKYTWRDRSLWGDALACYGINLVATAVAVPIAAIAFMAVAAITSGLWQGGYFAAVAVAMVIILPPLLGLPALQFYLKGQWRSSAWVEGKVSWRRTVAAYILTAVTANLAYLAFAVVFAGLIGAL